MALMGRLKVMPIAFYDKVMLNIVFWDRIGSFYIPRGRGFLLLIMLFVVLLPSYLSTMPDLQVESIYSEFTRKSFVTFQS